jgi:hypothetical protein
MLLVVPIGRAKGGDDSFWRNPVAPVPAVSIVARLHIRCNAPRVRSGADPHRLTTAHSAYFLSFCSKSPSGRPASLLQESIAAAKKMSK